MKRPLSQYRPIGPFSKQPLDLPAINNLGPNSPTSSDVGNILFRGASLSSLNSDEFKDNNINGVTIDVWTLDTAAAVKRYNIETERRSGSHKSSYFSIGATRTDLGQKIIDEFRIGPEAVNKFGVDSGIKEVPIKSLNENNLIAKHTETDVTGGLSQRLGVSIRFSGDFEDPSRSRSNGIQGAPIVLFLEKNRIPARLVEVEYTSNFIDNHTAIAGAADKGSKMVIAPSLTENFELGSHTARFGVSTTEKIQTLRDNGKLQVDIDDNDLVIEWFKDPLDNFKGLDAESELFAYAPKIDLDSALLGMCSYITKRRLEDISQIDSDKTEDMVESLYQKVQNNISSYKDRLLMCVVNRKPKSSRRRITRSQFDLLYDGTNFTRSYEEAIPFTDPEQF